MFSGLSTSVSDLSKLSNAKSRSISPENFTGEKGKGGMATKGTGENSARDLGIGWKISPSIQLKAGETFVLADIAAEGAIKHIWITDSMPNPRMAILRMYWDDSQIPSVEVPLGDFFATADQQNYAQISSLAVCVNPKRGLNCYWEMPFRKRARITLENISPEDFHVYFQIDYVETQIPDDRAYFHAQFRRTNPLPYATPYIIAENIQGKGQYVGTFIHWGVNNNGWWGEGEIKFFLDGDKEFPTICGTGTEDYFCGAYNFDVNGEYTPFTTPYAGLSKVSRTDQTYKTQKRFSLYRWHITDPIYFETDLSVTIQALGWRSGRRYLPLQDDISSVAYWYQDTPASNMPILPSVDELEIN